MTNVPAPNCPECGKPCWREEYLTTVEGETKRDAGSENYFTVCMYCYGVWMMSGPPSSGVTLRKPTEVEMNDYKDIVAGIRAQFRERRAEAILAAIERGKIPNAKLN